MLALPLPWHRRESRRTFGAWPRPSPVGVYNQSCSRVPDRSVYVRFHPKAHGHGRSMPSAFPRAWTVRIGAAGSAGECAAMVCSQALMQQKGSVVEELDLLESMHHEINRQARPPSQSAVRHTIRC